MGFFRWNISDFNLLRFSVSRDNDAFFIKRELIRRISRNLNEQNRLYFSNFFCQNSRDFIMYDIREGVIISIMLMVYYL